MSSRHVFLRNAAQPVEQDTGQVCRNTSITDGAIYSPRRNTATAKNRSALIEPRQLRAKPRDQQLARRLIGEQVQSHRLTSKPLNESIVSCDVSAAPVCCADEPVSKRTREELVRATSVDCRSLLPLVCVKIK